MKKTTLSLAGVAIAAAFSLTACGTSEEDLAKEYCDLVKESVEAVESGDTDKVKKAQDNLLEWAEDNKDAKGDEDKFTDAVNDECGDLSPLS